MLHAPVLDLLRSNADTLPRNQRALASYVSANYQTVAFANIAQLSEMAGVSTATIVRLARALGFDGYPAFQREIRRLVRADLRGTDRFKIAESGEGAPKAVASIIQKELENIASLEQSFDQAAFEGALQLLLASPAILVSGARSSAALANHLWFGLNKIALPVERALDVNFETREQINRLPQGALVILIGFPRYLRAQVELLAFVRERGLKSLTITDSVFSPLQGDISLYAPAESASFVAFHAAPLILINTFLHEVAHSRKQETLEALERFEHLAESQSVFCHGQKVGKFFSED